ncbi:MULTISPECIES: AraC family transcriptional regulator [unclassified Campylobacter]|uniref:helix-turn-helix domain-containing protein n=1 Tax=unclassified Campylobacter TaxID=2593542 RepID=UPI00147658F6
MKKIKVDEIYQKLHRYDGGDIDEKEMRISTKRVQINDDMDFWIQKFSFKNDTEIINDLYPINGFFINFTIEGGATLKTFNSKIKYCNNLTTISTANNLLADLQAEQGKNNINAGIFISNNFIKNNFSDIINPFENKVLQQSKTNLCSQFYLNQILNLNSDDPLDRLFVESKVLELIHNEFINLKRYKKQNNHVILSEFDKAAIIKAKEILASNIQNPPSIKELARKIKLNEFKLKFGFKKLFNQTPYEFLHKERIKHAFDLAKNSEMNISEISAAVGFKNQGYFAKAFKKHYNISPKDIMKTREYYY